MDPERVSCPGRERAGDKGDPGARSGRRGGEVRGEVRRDNGRGGRESRCRGSSYGRPSLHRTRGVSEVPRASVLEGWRFEIPPNHKPNQHYSACKLQHPNPPILKSAEKVRDSNLISTPSFANILYFLAFPHQATR